VGGEAPVTPVSSLDSSSLDLSYKPCDNRDDHSSRTYVRIRRMVLVSLYGVSDLFNIMHDYSDGVWILEMIQLMLSDDSDNGARDLIMI
jgi:hypothetical protein